MIGTERLISQNVLRIDNWDSWAHPLTMAENENATEAEWREGFRQRLRDAQGGRTQETMARLLGISRDAYSKYVGGRKSAMPIRLLPKFAAICDVSLEWLIEGRERVRSKISTERNLQRNTQLLRGRKRKTK